MSKHRKIILGRTCKTRGFVMDDGSLLHCGDKDCHSCNTIWEAVDKLLKEQVKKQKKL